MSNVRSLGSTTPVGAELGRVERLAEAGSLPITPTLLKGMLTESRPAFKEFHALPVAQTPDQIRTSVNRLSTLAALRAAHRAAGRASHIAWPLMGRRGVG